MATGESNKPSDLAETSTPEKGGSFADQESRRARAAIARRYQQLTSLVVDKSDPRPWIQALPLTSCAAALAAGAAAGFCLTGQRREAAQPAGPSQTSQSESSRFAESHAGPSETHPHAHLAEMIRSTITSSARPLVAAAMATLVEALHPHVNLTSPGNGNGNGHTHASSS